MLIWFLFVSVFSQLVYFSCSFEKHSSTSCVLWRCAGHRSFQSIHQSLTANMRLWRPHSNLRQRGRKEHERCSNRFTAQSNRNPCLRAWLLLRTPRLPLTNWFNLLQKKKKKNRKREERYMVMCNSIADRTPNTPTDVHDFCVSVGRWVLFYDWSVFTYLPTSLRPDSCC